jgi:hypothetical protein
MVSAAIVRVHGNEFCELPLVATRVGHQRADRHGRRMVEVGFGVCSC